MERAMRWNDLSSVSIRTPVLGVISTFTLWIYGIICFNPHPRVGGDSPPGGTVLDPFMGFNPHPRVGGDSEALEEMSQDTDVSIRTPVLGVIFTASPVEVYVVWFQSAPPCWG